MYDGYLAFGGNEIINNNRALGMSRTADCPVTLLKPDYCDSMRTALDGVQYTEWSEILATNLATNPSFEKAGPEVTVRENLATNPSFETAGAPVTVRENLAGNPDLVGGAEGASVPGYLGVTRSGGKAMIAAIGYGPHILGAPGDKAGLRVRVVSATTKEAYVRIYAASTGGGITGPVVAEKIVELVANVPQEIALTGTLTAPLTAGWRFQIPTSLELLGVIATDTATEPETIFSGATPDAGDFTYEWSGAPNASTSRQRALTVAEVSSQRVATVRSNEWAASGEHSMRLIATTSNSTSYARIPLTYPIGTVLTVSGTFRLDAPQSSAGDLARTITAARDNGQPIASSAQAPNEAGETRLQVTFATETGLTYIMLGSGATRGGADVWWDDLLIVEGVYDGPYFDGDTPDEGDFTYEWAGAENASVSRQRALTVAGIKTGGAATYLQSEEWAGSGGKSLRVIAPDSSLKFVVVADHWGGNYLERGKTYTARVTARYTEQVAGPSSARILFTGPPVISDAAGTVEPGVYDLQITFTVPTGSGSYSLRLYNGGAVGGPDVWYDDLIVVEGTYDGPYFDGERSDSGFNPALEELVWLGDPDESASTRRTREFIVPAPYTFEDITDAPWFDPSNVDLSQRFYGAYALSIEGVSDSTRSVQVTEGIDDGGVIGRTRKGMKQVTVRAVLVSKGSDAMEYGRAWLEAALDPDACGQHGDGCGSTDLEFFATCPPVFDEGADSVEAYGDDETGLRRYLHGVAVTSGPFTVERWAQRGWDAHLIEFTVTTARPWIYSATKPVSLPVTPSTVAQDIPYNLVPFPSAEISAASVVVATNYVPNPSVESNLTGWSKYGDQVAGSATQTQVNNATVQTRSAVLKAVGGWGVQTRFSMTENYPAGQQSTIESRVPRVSGLTPGQRISFSVWAAAIKTNAAVTITEVRVEAQFKGGGGGDVDPPVLINSTTDTAEFSGTVHSKKSVEIPAGADGVQVTVYMDINWSSTAALRPDVSLFTDAAIVSRP